MRLIPESMIAGEVPEEKLLAMGGPLADATFPDDPEWTDGSEQLLDAPDGGHCLYIRSGQRLFFSCLIADPVQLVGGVLDGRWREGAEWEEGHERAFERRSVGAPASFEVYRRDGHTALHSESLEDIVTLNGGPLDQEIMNGLEWAKRHEMAFTVDGRNEAYVRGDGNEAHYIDTFVDPVEILGGPLIGQIYEGSDWAVGEDRKFRSPGFELWVYRRDANNMADFLGIAMPEEVEGR